MAAMRIWGTSGVVLALACACARAQCARDWLPGTPVRGVDSAVRALSPSNSGYTRQTLFVGGEFTAAGHLAVQGIVEWDPARLRWRPLGNGIVGKVNALTLLPSGDLVAGGRFTVPGVPMAANIARWDGETWHPVRSTRGWISGNVHALTTTPDGNLVAGGEFTGGPGVFSTNIALWNGVHWSPLGEGFDRRVRALTCLANGDIIAGGWFTRSGTTNLGRIARWDGMSWQAMGSGVGNPGDEVLVLGTLSNGDVVAAGRFTQAGGAPANNIARWDGNDGWHPLGAGLTGHPIVYVTAMHVLPDDHLIVGGDFFMAGGKSAEGVARWDGTSWSAAGERMIGYPDAFALLNTGKLYAGGLLTIDGSTTRPSCIVEWDGDDWAPLGPPAPALDSAVTQIAIDSAGDLIIGGWFANAGGEPLNRIARLRHGAWEPLGTGVDGYIYGVLPISDGSIYVGGRLWTAGGLPVNRIARWSAGQWSPLGDGLNHDVTAIERLPGGDIVAAGTFTSAGGVPAGRIARWDGSQWHPLGAGLNNTVYDIEVLNNGDLAVAGEFSMAGPVPASTFARWDGEVWHAMPWFSHFRFKSLAVWKGQLWAMGDYGPPVTREILFWNGTTWAPIPPPPTEATLPLIPTQDLLMVKLQESPTSGGVRTRLAAWDGHNWTTLDGSLNGTVFAAREVPGGDLMVGGSFTTAGAHASVNLARWGCPCYADCDNSGGPHPLNVEDFTCFLQQFAAASTLPHGEQVNHYANCDRSNVAPALNVDDVLCYISGFALGCE